MDKQPSSRSCFVCGRQNDFSLKMNWYNDHEAQQIKGEVVVPDQYNGYPGFVHGGIVATILDETSGRAVMLDGDINSLFVTTHLEVKYRRPTPTGQPLTAVGWVLRQDKNRARVAGEIRLADGTVTASCKAIVMRAPQKYLEAWNWQDEAPFWKVYED
ncbi:PaaI family thioesterase [Syntrophomonas palmitatica]|uniref:PaaI family thioesterase n=1 Tax=Syntrophomonas palmitatica TaxID=402877 RepID=UPI0006D00554|nr:PaaI family thioesterase [Syntrophomonas palmitatica]